MFLIVFPSFVVINIKYFTFVIDMKLMEETLQKAPINESSQSEDTHIIVTQRNSVEWKKEHPTMGEFSFCSEISVRCTWSLHIPWLPQPMPACSRIPGIASKSNFWWALQIETAFQ